MMGEVCSISGVPYTCQVLGALTNPSLEHEVTTAIMGKNKLAGSPVCTLNFQGEELVFFFPMKMIKRV